MIKNIRFNILLAATVAIFGVTACSSLPVQEFPATADATYEVQSLEADLNAAKQNQVNVLSPHNYKKARSSLRDAQKQLRNQSDAKKTLRAVAEGRTYYKRAMDFAELSNSNIGEVMNARRDAIAAGAPNSIASDFKDADKKLVRVTSDIEKNDLRAAIKNRSELQLKYLDLELRAIKSAHLSNAINTIAKAKKEDASKFAPRTLAIAEKSVLDTDAFITANRHNVAAIESRALATQESADLLLKITRNAKLGGKRSNEDQALALEAKQVQLNQKAHELAQGETAIQQLANQNSTLESENELNARFEEARAQFTKNEAEVYKQGNVLMIRLRGLDFPVAQATLKGSNFPLLAKVQKVIQDFGSSSVTVEGHTDSTGGQELNQRLSDQRAAAVKEYFAANMPGENIKLNSVGYGFQKPLSTNKTQEGRAQNRRVDILIQPEAASDSATF